MYNYSSSNQIRTQDNQSPLDTVSQIVWDKKSDNPAFLCSSWDGYVRYYILNESNKLNRAWQFFMQHPVLCCDLGQNNIAFAGLASGDIVAVSLQNNAIIHLGSHEAPICGVFWIKEFNCLMTLGFDTIINFWSLQANNGQYHQMRFDLPLKTVTACFDYPYLGIGSIQSTIVTLNLKNLPNISIPREYTKVNIEKFSKFCCSSMNAKGMKSAYGTSDGRSVSFDIKDGYQIKYESFMVNRTQKKQQSHKTLFGQVTTVDIGYYNYDTYLAVGGTDDYAVFNIHKKLRSKGLVNPNSAVGSTTASKIHPNNKYIAFANGTDWAKGIQELENIKKPKITLYRILGGELNEWISK